MKFSSLSLLALSASVITARFIEDHETDQVVLYPESNEELFLVELAGGEQRWITEDEKWELRRVSLSICDSILHRTNKPSQEWPELYGHHGAP